MRCQGSAFWIQNINNAAVTVNIGGRFIISAVRMKGNHFGASLRQINVSVLFKKVGCAHILNSASHIIMTYQRSILPVASFILRRMREVKMDEKTIEFLKYLIEVLFWAWFLYLIFKSNGNDEE